MSLRSLLRASTLYTAGNLAPKLGAFLLLPIYVRFLSQADYGSLALITSLAGILAIVYHLGVDSSLMRLHFDRSGRDRARLYSTLTVFTLGLGALLTVVMALVLGPFFETLFAGTPFLPLGALGLLVAFVGSLGYVPSAFLRATGQASRFLALNLGAFVLSSVIAVTLVTAFGFGAAGVLTAQLISGFVVLVTAIALVSRLGAWTFDRAALLEALRFGLPLLPHSLSAWALRLADRWLIALLIGLPALEARSQIGIYAVGYQLGFVVSLVLTSFNSAWSPYFFRVGQRRDGPRFHTEMTTLVMGGLLLLAVTVSVLAPEMVAVIARPGYEPAADVIPVIAFGSVLQGLYVMFVTVVFLTKRTGRLAAITFSSAALNVTLNVVLIPQLGIMGAAWSTLASYGFFAAATFFFAQSIYPMRIDWPRVAAVGALGVGAVLLARLSSGPPSLGTGLVHVMVAMGYGVAVTVLCWPSVERLRSISRSLARDEVARA